LSGASLQGSVVFSTLSTSTLLVTIVKVKDATLSTGTSQLSAAWSSGSIGCLEIVAFHSVVVIIDLEFKLIAHFIISFTSSLAVS
jgi:hypothetical protein